MPFSMSQGNFPGTTCITRGIGTWMGVSTTGVVPGSITGTVRQFKVPAFEP